MMNKSHTHGPCHTSLIIIIITRGTVWRVAECRHRVQPLTTFPGSQELETADRVYLEASQGDGVVDYVAKELCPLPHHHTRGSHIVDSSAQTALSLQHRHLQK